MSLKSLQPFNTSLPSPLKETSSSIVIIKKMRITENWQQYYLNKIITHNKHSQLKFKTYFSPVFQKDCLFNWKRQSSTKAKRWMFDAVLFNSDPEVCIVRWSGHPTLQSINQFRSTAMEINLNLFKRDNKFLGHAIFILLLHWCMMATRKSQRKWKCIKPTFLFFCRFCNFLLG